MRFALPLLALTIATACNETEPSRYDLVGPVTHVRDGDTIEVAGTPVRLNGLHAPELRDPYGAEAKAMMARIVTGQEIGCELTGGRSYDRVIGVCYGEDGQDIAAELVAAGLGRDCPRYSGGRYRAVETDWARQRFRLPGYC